MKKLILALGLLGAGALAVLLWIFVLAPGQQTPPSQTVVFEVVATTQDPFAVRYIVGADDVTQTATSQFVADVSTSENHAQFVVSLEPSTQGDRTVTCRVSIGNDVIVEQTSETGFVDCTTDLPRANDGN